jgi:DNA-binding transcriptional ArsR family regulator
MVTHVTKRTSEALKEALTERTRGMIFHELLLHGEMTATRLAGRLGLQFRNVAYHLQQLQEAGIVERCREVASGFRVEKYYRLSEEILWTFRGDHTSVDRTMKAASPEERRAIYVSHLAMAANILARSAEYVARMDLDEFDEEFGRQRLGMVGFGPLSRDRYRQQLEAARSQIAAVQWESPGDTASNGEERSDLIVLAFLPNAIPVRKNS